MEEEAIKFTEINKNQDAVTKNSDSLSFPNDVECSNMEEEAIKLTETNRNQNVVTQNSDSLSFPNDVECSNMEEAIKLTETNRNQDVTQNSDILSFSSDISNSDHKPIDIQENAQDKKTNFASNNFTPNDSRKDEIVCDTEIVSYTTNSPLSDIETEHFNFPQYVFKNSNLFEIAQKKYSNNEQQPYLRGCKWSPDGTCLLYAVRGNGMSIVEIPSDMYSNEYMPLNRDVSKLEPVVSIPENSMLYDFCWYPGMTSQQPATCCWLTSFQHAPVQLWDAFTGELRCTYRGYDLVDEIEAALSVNFSVDGKKIFCGYKKALRIFSTDRPGRDFEYYKMAYPITCIAANSIQPEQIALGSWYKLIELVDDRSGVVRTLHKLTGHFGGLTYLKFSPDGTCLYSGARKDNELICWDLRVPGRPLFSLFRKSDTNQTIYFDISPCGTYVFTGGTDGILKITSLLENSSIPGSKFKEYNFQLHNDCLNSISVHPYRPLLATGSGQHHFFSNSDNDSCDEEMIQDNIDNSIKIWWLGKINENTFVHC